MTLKIQFQIFARVDEKLFVVIGESNEVWKLDKLVAPAVPGIVTQTECKRDQNQL